jgi:hypothetical protein
LSFVTAKKPPLPKMNGNTEILEFNGIMITAVSQCELDLGEGFIALGGLEVCVCVCVCVCVISVCVCVCV